MRRVVLATALLSGCGFVDGKPYDPHSPPPLPGNQGDGGTSPSVACHSNLPGTVVCLDFEQPTAAGMIDAANTAHIVTPSGVAMIGRVTAAGTQGAVLMGGHSLVHIAAAPDLELSPALSVELWVAPTSTPPPPPPGGPAQPPHLAASAGEWSMFLAGDHLTCNIHAPAPPDLQIYSAVPIVAARWTHVACTYDGSQLRVYVDGDLTYCSGEGGPPLSTATNAGLDFGAAYAGGLDDIGIYSQTLSAADICGLAGRTGCASTCPT